MRKIDYQILANLIRDSISVNNWNTSAVRPDCADYADKILRNLAMAFAKRAAVDEVNFLKSCGL